MDERRLSVTERRPADNAGTVAKRRLEAERLIGLARALLTAPEEEIAAIYLDHAIDTLHMIPLYPVD